MVQNRDMEYAVFEDGENKGKYVLEVSERQRG